MQNLLAESLLANTIPDADVMEKAIGCIQQAMDEIAGSDAAGKIADALAVMPRQEPLTGEQALSGRFMVSSCNRSGQNSQTRSVFDTGKVAEVDGTQG